MKLINDRWVDENNNSWDANTETEESAELKSKSLNNCSDCSDCSGCSDCSVCLRCLGCSRCSRCSGCSHCSYCSDCLRCSHCLGCSDCSDFKSNPERIISPKIGRRNGQSTFYWNSEHEQVICGCFRGTLEQFEERVNTVHGDNEHGIAYRNWIEKIKQYKS